MSKFLLIFAFSVVSAIALPNPENVELNNVEPSIESTARAMGKDCPYGIFSATCLKIQAISVLEKLSSKDELRLLPGLSVVKESKENDTNAEEFAAEMARDMPSKPDERLDKYLLYKLGSYLDNHSVKLSLLDTGVTEDARALIGEARKGYGYGGKKYGMGGLIAAAMMMKGTLMYLGIKAVAVLAGKALVTALISLAISAIIGLKSLSSGGGKSTTYEIVSKPIYSHSHSHSHEDVGGYGGYEHSGYGRNLKIKRR